MPKPPAKLKKPEPRACGDIRYRVVRGPREAAGVPVFAPQGLRRAAVGALYRSGVDVGTAAAFLGHSPVTALHHYREASEADRRGAMLRSGLGRLVEEQGQVIQLSERRQRRER